MRAERFLEIYSEIVKEHKKAESTEAVNTDLQSEVEKTAAVNTDLQSEIEKTAVMAADYLQRYCASTPCSECIFYPKIGLTCGLDMQPLDYDLQNMQGGADNEN